MRLTIACAVAAVGLLSILALPQSAEAQANPQCPTVPCVEWRLDEEIATPSVALINHVAEADGLIITATAQSQPSMVGKLRVEAVHKASGVSAWVALVPSTGPTGSGAAPYDLVLHDDMVLVSYLYDTVALDLADGSLVWLAGTGALDLAVSDGVAFIMGGNGADATTLAVEVTGGKQLWQATWTGAAGLTESAYSGVISSDGTSLLVTGQTRIGTGITPQSFRTFVVSYDADTGAQEWTLTLPDAPVGKAVIHASQGRAYLDHTVVDSMVPEAGLTQRAVFALDESNGAALWDYRWPVRDTGFISFGSGAALGPAGDVLYVVANLNEVGPAASVVALDTASGAPHWETRIENGADEAGIFAVDLDLSTDGTRLAVGSSLPEALSVPAACTNTDLLCPSVGVDVATIDTATGNILVRGAQDHGPNTKTYAPAVSMGPNDHVNLFYTHTIPGYLAFHTQSLVVESMGDGRNVVKASGPSLHFTTIQAAIDAARDGDTVKVAPGVYYENVVIDKAITLQGAGSGADPAVDTVLHTARRTTSGTTGCDYTAIVHVQASQVRMRDLRVDGELLKPLSQGAAVGTANPCLGTGSQGVRIGKAGTDLVDIEVEGVAAVRNQIGFAIAVAFPFPAAASGSVTGVVVRDSLAEGNMINGFLVGSDVSVVRDIAVESSLFQQNGGTGPEALILAAVPVAGSERADLVFRDNSFVDAACASRGAIELRGVAGANMEVIGNDFTVPSPAIQLGFTTRDVTLLATGNRIRPSVGLSVPCGSATTPPALIADKLLDSVLDVRGNDWGVYGCRDVRSQIVEGAGSSGNTLLFTPYLDASGAVMEDDCPVWVERGDERVGPFFTIQDGIDAALPGDTVRVELGIYSESVVLGDGITLAGRGNGTVLLPKVDAAGCATDPIVEIRGSAVTVTNMALVKQWQGSSLLPALAVEANACWMGVPAIHVGPTGENLHDVSMQRIEISDFGRGIVLGAGQGSLQGISFADGALRRTAEGIVVAADVPYLDGLLVSNSTFERRDLAGGCLGTACFATRPIEIFSFAGNPRHNVRIVDNLFHGAGDNLNGGCSREGQIMLGGIRDARIAVERNLFLTPYSPGLSIYGYQVDGWESSNATLILHDNIFRQALSECALTSSSTLSWPAHAMTIGLHGPIIESRLDLRHNDWGAYSCSQVPLLIHEGPFAVGITADFEPWLTPSGALQDDCPGPVLTLPADMALEATGSAGAVATFTATADDEHEGPTAVTCSLASGSTFPVEATTVSCTTRDQVGNTMTGSFTITVQDTTPPTLTLPAGLTAAATTNAGTPITYAASAQDAVDGSLSGLCSIASGAVFPLGSSTVTCTATDASGNTATGSFPATVTYSWSAFLRPFDESQTLTGGKQVKVKFELTGASAGITDATANLYVAPVTSTGVGPEAPAQSTQQLGNAFTYANGKYEYKWSTATVSPGTWQIRADLGDGVVRTATVVVS